MSVELSMNGVPGQIFESLGLLKQLKAVVHSFIYPKSLSSAKFLVIFELLVSRQSKRL
jgi:hypothetical protein